MILTGVPVVGFVGVSAYGLYIYANHDRIELVDDPEVEEVVASACARLDSRRETFTFAGDESPEAQVTAIRSGNSAVAEMVASVRELGERRLEQDMPTQPWLEDWETLVTLREQYAVDLEGGGSPTFVVPRVDDIPVTGRMSELDDDCASALRALDSGLDLGPSV